MQQNASHLSIEKVILKKDIPFDLLLLADETIEDIDKYLDDSEVYVAKQSGSVDPIAVFVLRQLSASDVELKNIAVAENLQGTGIGSWLINTIKQIVKQQG